MPMREYDKPLISVLMGVRYRREDTFLLRRSVESIIAQTVQDFEFIICDDGSTEQASIVLDELAAKDARIRLVRPGDKMDLASKLNACISVSKGTYFARMDDDDYSYPVRFEQQLTALAEAPEISFVGSNAVLWCDGKSIKKQIFPEFPTVRDFYMVQPFLHPTLMFRREAMEAVGGYSENGQQQLCEDYDLLLRMYAKGMKGMNLQISLLDYTVPITTRGGRTMQHRWNEVVTRWNRFRELGALPNALPYVIKPLLVGLLPNGLLRRVKFRYYGGN